MIEFTALVGWEGRYEITPFGVVKSLARTRKGKGGCALIVPEKILNQKIDRYGYPCVSLNRDAKCFTYTVHRLVAINFIQNPESKPQINHKDGNKLNNHYSNLEWCTGQENMTHCYDVLNRTRIIGAKPLYQFDLAGVLIKQWNSLAEACRNGFTKKSILMVVNGKSNHHKGFLWKR